MIEAALFLGAYLLGAVPFGYLVARAHGVNLFEIGSGNVGATNVKRALGLGPAIFVFALDVERRVPTMLAMRLLGSQDWAIGVGVAAILGHCFSPFLRFKGGKGIATGLGVLLGCTPFVALSVFAVFLVGLAVHRFVSLSSITSVIAAPFFGWLFGDSPGMFLFYGALFLFVLYTHRANIQRLSEGTEPKFDFRNRKKDNSDPEKPPKDEMSAHAPYPKKAGGQHA